MDTTSVLRLHVKNTSQGTSTNMHQLLASYVDGDLQPIM